MTTNIFFANTNDAYLFSTDNAYATALTGPADGISTAGDTTLFVGQQKSGTPYTIWQSFLEFAITVAAGNSAVSGYFRLTSSSVTGTSVTRGLDIMDFDFGTLATNDWRSPNGLVSLNNTAKAAGVANIQNASNLAVRAGLVDLTDVDAAATKRFILASSRNRLQNTPTGLEYNGFRSADFSGTDSDPTIYTTTNVDSLLSRCLGAQVQLSDGSHAYVLMSSQTLGSDAFTVNYRTAAGTVTVIDTIPDITGVRRGAQGIAMCRDEDDNLYVLSRTTTSNTLQVRAYTKNPVFPGVWSTSNTVRSITLPTYDQEINNIAVTWHRRGGSAGTLLAIVGHSAGSNLGTEMPYVLLNCDILLTSLPDWSAFNVLRGSGNAVGTLIAASSVDGYHNFTNETGTLLDISSSRAVGDDTGFVTSAARHHVLGSNSSQSTARYTINSTGTGFTEVWNNVDTFSGFSTKDGNAKSLILPVNNSGIQYVTVNASSSTDFGIVVKHRQQQGSSFTVLSEVRLDAQGLATMPSSSTLAAANNWDAIYNPLDNKVWVYYFDKNNAQRLMRTSVDLNTGQAGKEEFEVNATVGATGSSNLTIRTHRGHTSGQQMLVTVANRTSGGTHSIIYVADTINVAPTQPTLITRANFDATASAQFQWTFNDPNAGDTQSFYRLLIENDTTGASAWDSQALGDNFTRSVTGGWGTSTTGQAWTVVNGTVSTDYDTTGNVGRHVHTSRDIFRISYVPSFSSADVDYTATVTIPVLPTGDSLYSYFLARVNGAVDTYYFARLEVTTSGTTNLSIRKRTPSETLLATASASLTHVAGQSYRVRLRVRGNTIRTKAWLITDAEPADWQVSATDTSITAAGSVGLRSFAPSTNTNAGSIAFTFDDLSVMAGSANGTYTLPANALTNEQNWRWRVQTWDASDAISPFSNYGFFTTSSKGVVNITDPTVDNDPAIVTANYLLKWSVTNTTQAAYNITVTRVDTGATLISTGWVSSTATQYLIQGMSSDLQWNVALKVRNAALIESNTANRRITPNYNRPEVPVIAFDIEDDLGYIQLNVTNPDPVGDRPNPSANEVHRRVYNANNPNTAWQVLGTIDPNSILKDYTAASGVLYEYRVKAIAGQFFTYSTETTADRELDLSGVWLHDPAAPDTTIHQFPYGKDSRSTALDTISTEQQFAGRTFPVVDFGEFEQEDITVALDIPGGDDHFAEVAAARGFMEMKKVLFFRDNRGRALYGTMSGYNQADASWGVNVGFKFGRVSFDIEEV